MVDFTGNIAPKENGSSQTGRVVAKNAFVDVGVSTIEEEGPSSNAALFGLLGFNNGNILHG